MNDLAANRALLVVLAAPSGAGKTTLCQQLLSARTSFVRAVTCTTRAPRTGERPGVDYHFLDREAFQKRLDAGAFLEHATVYENWYGTEKHEVIEKLNQGQDVLLTVDVQGAQTIRRIAAQDPRLRPALVSVFLTPRKLSELEYRLRKRNQNDPIDLAKRLGEARQEIAQWMQFDYLLISTTIPEDLNRMLSIVDAEKMRVNRASPPET